MSFYVQREKRNFTAEDAAAGKSAYVYVTTTAPQIVDGDLAVEWGAQHEAAAFAEQTAEVDGVEVLGAQEIAELLGAMVTLFEAPPPTPASPPDARTEREERQARVAARQARKAAERAAK